mgnify:CR=1 FL=1
MSSLVRPDAWGNVAQDLNTLYQVGKWGTILGTGYLIGKNPRLGLEILGRTGWAVFKGGARTAVEVAKIWQTRVFNPYFAKFRPAAKKPPVELVRLNPGQSPPRYGRPPKGGALGLAVLGIPIALGLMAGASALGLDSFANDQPRTLEEEIQMSA